MRTTFEEIIQVTLNHEGGYVNNPNDKGGPTNHGITLRTYSRYLKRKATIEDIQNLDIESAKDIYHRLFWVPCRVEELPESLRQDYFDMVVNHGQRNAVFILQSACNSVRGQGSKIKEDGIIGGNTIGASQHPKMSREILSCYRILFYASLVLDDALLQHRTNQEEFWLGWFRRALTYLKG